MDVAGKILRRSVHGFLQNYHYFTSVSAFMVLPFSTSFLLSQALVPSSSSLFPQISNRLTTLFDAAGFPSSSSSKMFGLFSLKASETIASSIFTLPFTLTFLIIAKASIFQALKHPYKPAPSPSSFTSMISLYKPLLKTCISSSLLIISAIATSYCLLFFALGVVEGFDATSPDTLFLVTSCGVVLFSVFLANALVIGNMAMALSGMEGHGGYLAVLKACVLLRGRTSMALLLALPMNMALAAIEALFQFRVVRAYRTGGQAEPWMASEAIFIAYLYSIFVVLDTIVASMFYKNCKTRSWIDDVDAKLLVRIEISEKDSYEFDRTKNFEELP
ncbi:uncharacterized protein LOC129309722 [Prosopis cineraria]|uniref:uncharacterized protein LOC129309722 n=1 Tax=Prosopis cineraria TaxID=364024 RepID=UPI00240F5240|nr:uncharacterized protein LOC129309722 [Prosopis cineraria]